MYVVTLISLLPSCGLMFIVDKNCARWIGYVQWVFFCDDFPNKVCFAIQKENRASSSGLVQITKYV